MEVNEIIKQRRLELDLTLKDVARVLGVTEATVSRYESRDIKNMGIDKIKSLSRVLRCSPGYLMGWEDEPNKLNTNILKLDQTEMEIIRKFRTLNDGERAMFLRAIGVREKRDGEKMA